VRSIVVAGAGKSNSQRRLLGILGRAGRLHGGRADNSSPTSALLASRHCSSLRGLVLGSDDDRTRTSAALSGRWQSADCRALLF